MRTRPRPGPPPEGITLHAIGDAHVGPASSNEAWRLDAVARDSAKLPAPAAVVQLGDGCNNSPAADAPILDSFMDRLGAPWWAVMGNHDINEDVQTPAQWAARLGYPAPSYTVDMEGLRLVMLSASAQWSNYEVAPPASLTWLDGAIGGTTNPVIVCCHYPLYGTVGAVTGIDTPSTVIPYYIRTAATPGSSADILAVLAAHANVKAWISGHTHSRIEAPDLVKAVDLGGGNRLAAINASSIWYCYPPPSPYPLDARETINTLYVTLLRDRIEVRARDHGAGRWASPNGNPLWTVDL